MGTRADAEDLTSQVFAEALEALPGYREQGRFSAWLFRLAQRRVVDHHRRRRPAEPWSEETGRPDKGADPLARLVQQEALYGAGTPDPAFVSALEGRLLDLGHASARHEGPALSPRPLWQRRWALGALALLLALSATLAALGPQRVWTQIGSKRGRCPLASIPSK